MLPKQYILKAGPYVGGTVYPVQRSNEGHNKFSFWQPTKVGR